MKSNTTGRRLLIAALIAAIAVPILNTAVIGSVTTVLASDVMIPPILSAVLSFVSEFITLASAFAAAACLSFACTAGILRRWIILITALSAPIAYITAVIVDISFYGTTVMKPAYITFSIVSCFFELLRYALVLVIALLIARAAEKRGMAGTLELLSVTGTLSLSALSAAGVTGISMLLSNISETVSLLTRYGAPANTSETLTLISPYITTVIFTILGYFLSYLIHRILRRDLPELPREETI